MHEVEIIIRAIDKFDEIFETLNLLIKISTKFALIVGIISVEIRDLCMSVNH